MWLHQVEYALITLISVTIILSIIGILIFNGLKIYSGRFLTNDDPKLLNIVFVGTILIALSQLFGPLVASTYPIVFGPEASDYRLSFDSVYCDISYNNSTGNYKMILTTDREGMIYDKKEDTNISIYDSVNIKNRIEATNLNPFADYDDQIFLSVVDSSFVTYLSRPVIKVGQSSDLYIQLNRPDPGTYPIKLRGIGEDGRIRETTMVIGISIPDLPNTYYTSAATYTPSYSTYTGSYTPSYSGNTATYTPSYSGNTATYTPSYSGNSGSYTPSYSSNSGSYTPSYSSNSGSYTPSYSSNSG